MANSIVSICNNALIRIGSKTITSLLDGDKVANSCNAIYERTRDSLLRMHLWNFAIKRQVLAQDLTAPAFTFKYQYSLPADFIRVVRLEDPTEGYKIEGGKLLTNSSQVNLIYVSQATDPSKYDPLFTEALILMLAINLSFILIGSSPREGALKEELKGVLFSARQVDGQDDTPDSLDASSFLEAKYLSAWDTTKVYGSWPL